MSLHNPLRSYCRVLPNEFFNLKKIRDHTVIIIIIIIVVNCRRRRASCELSRMEEPSVSCDKVDETISDIPNETSNLVDDASEDIRILSVDKLTVEKIVLEKGGSREVLFTKSESSKKLLEKTRLVKPKLRSSLWRKRANSTDELLSASKNHSVKFGNRYGFSVSNDGRFTDPKNATKLSIWKAEKSGSASSLNEKRISPIRLTKSSSIGSLGKFNRLGKTSNSGKIRKIPPKVPAKPSKKKYNDVPYFGPVTILEQSKDIAIESSTKIIENPKSQVNSSDLTQEHIEDTSAVENKAHERLEKSQTEIERLQKNLQTKINATTAETYKQKLPGLQSSLLKVVPISDLDLNENVTKASFDKEFLERHNFDKKLKIEEKRLLETDIDYVSDVEKSSESAKHDKPKYSKKVLEIEKRWSGEFLAKHLEQNSSESSYVEEFGSVSSRESITNCETERKLHTRKASVTFEDLNEESTKQQSFEEIFEDTVSTVDSDSCFEDRIKAIDDHINEADESKESTLTESLSVKTNVTASSEINLPLEIGEESIESQHLDTINKSETALANKTENTPVTSTKSLVKSSPLDVEFVESKKDRSESPRRTASPDGYASLIKEFTMEPGSSKSPKEEKKKKSGFRRLLPGIFSPKESRKDIKKEPKERRKRDDKHFNQYQQNGIFTRSPDTMNLNDDITRNVKLDTSLNSSIIEERLNEIKQELFPEQGMTTSTPDHFLQCERTFVQDPRSGRSFTVNSSLSSIAPEDKWLEHNIISGSPDMRKFKQQMANDNQRKCNLERKHSLQESNQPRFLRNHGPSGRISAPPSERFLIRPRAVHPVDRPLPAIPQKMEFLHYQNRERKHPNFFGRSRPAAVTNHEPDGYLHMSGNQNYVNDPTLYENGNHMTDRPEINRNQDVDASFNNMTAVSAQVKVSRQIIVNQNQTASIIARSPKYSPSASQKSGDYADSSYTPNSSQKSEFSPGSSKSGEYYLNSPRNSCRTSPDESLNDQRDQTLYDQHNEHQTNLGRESSESVPYPVSPKIRVECKDDRVYDEAPVSPLQEVRVDKLSLSPRNLTNQNNVPQDTSYISQKTSANIPLSSNLAKLRAHVEGTVTDGAESPINVDDRFNDSNRQDGSRVTSPSLSSRILASPIQFRDPSPSKDDKEQRSPSQNHPRMMSPSRLQRIASPLSILTPGPASPIPTSMISPCGSSNACLSPTNARSMTPTRILMQTANPTQNVQRRIPNQSSQLRTPVPSPNMNQSRMTPSTGPYTPMSSFNPRRAQPNDQILIASPKRDASLYETQMDRASNKMESACPDSPVPMPESPSQILPSRSQIMRHNVAECNKPERMKSPIPGGTKDQSNQIRSENKSTQSRASPVVRAMSPLIDITTSPSKIQRPEPIYVRRENAVQRAMSPMLVHSENRRDHNPVAFSGENRSDTLLVQVRPENNMQNRGFAPNQGQQQSQGNMTVAESVYAERRVQSPLGSPRTHAQRPEAIYMHREQNLVNAGSLMRKQEGQSVSASGKSGQQTYQHETEVNQSLKQMQIDPRRGQQINEGFYSDRKSTRARQNLVNEQIYDTRRSQQSPGPRLAKSSVDQYGQRADPNVAEQNREITVRRSPQQQQQQHQQQQSIYGSRQETLAGNQQPRLLTRQSNSKDPIYGQRQSLKQQEPIYSQRTSEPIYGQQTNRQLSPSKRQMIQNLEAFYWQQKALDNQRLSMNSPTIPNVVVHDVKIESPEFREAIYWQQLKKLDEEQQRRLFEESQMDEHNESHYRRKRVQGSASPSPVGNTMRHGSVPTLANQSLSLVPTHYSQQNLTENEQIYWQSKVQQAKNQIPVGKPPMIGQKGQNQPVLVVRPQQAVRENNQSNQSPIYDQRDGAKVRQDAAPRSKSVSPHFGRGDERRSLSLPRKPSVLNDDGSGSVKNRDARGPIRKTLTPPIYEVHDIEGKKSIAPPPIFKRGSLISNSSSSVEYGTMGPKRVSFSNQGNSPEVGTGNWPTKHGMAPEPPTRKHRTEENTSVSFESTDSLFLHGNEENQNNSNNVYGNIVNRSSGQGVQSATPTKNSTMNEQANIYETEYDAKPLPPPPREASTYMLRRSSSMRDHNSGRITKTEVQRVNVSANPRKWPGVSESESGSEAGEVQRILYLRNGESLVDFFIS